MGGSAPKAPSAPDPYKTAEAQYTFNMKAFEDVLRQGTLDQSGPGGSVTYDRDAEGNPTGVNSSLSGPLQSAYDSLTGTAGHYAGMLPQGAFNPNVDGSAVRDAYVRQGLDNVEGLWGRQDDARNVMYAERGLPIGSEIWGNTERETGEQRNQYLGQLSNQAYQAGTQEEQRQFQNALVQRGLPQSELANVLNTMGGISSMVPGANPLPIQNLASPNYAGLAQNNYNTQMGQYNQQLASQSAGQGQMAGLAGTALMAMMMMSDERLKEDVEPVGVLQDGQEPLPIYEWSYKGDPERHIGPMAQDLAETNPELVARHPSGFLMIDASAPTRPTLAALLRAGNLR